MKNANAWKPTSVLVDRLTNRVVPNLQSIYAGSMHICNVQLAAYLPVFKKWCKGKLLDCGCGRVPYYELIKDQITMHYCIDHSERPDVIQYLDEQIDLNKHFLLCEDAFDTVLITDVIAHVAQPALLVQCAAEHMRQGGALILTTPFVYWISEYPHEYFHPTDTALRDMCKEAGLNIVHLEPYGGYPDVLLDTLNKGMTSRLSNRLFRMLASVVKKMSWYKKSNEKTKYSYPLGYVLVAMKQ